MAKTLVIKGANFIANKLTTVEFSAIPCTGIALDESSYSVIALGDLDIGYTLTPEDTTDDVIWTSSDANVVDVSGGSPVAVGVGSCTITATCGNFSDSATVNVNIIYNGSWEFGLPNADSVNGYIGLSSSMARIYSSGVGLNATQYKMVGAGVSSSACKLPQNTGRIKIKSTHTDTFLSGNYSTVIWAKDESAGYSALPTAIKLVSSETDYNIRTYSEKVFNVPDGADAFVFCVRLTTSGQTGDDANDSATAGGLTIEFLPSETE